MDNHVNGVGTAGLSEEIWKSGRLALGLILHPVWCLGVFKAEKCQNHILVSGKLLWHEWVSWWQGWGGWQGQGKGIRREVMIAERKGGFGNFALIQRENRGMRNRQWQGKYREGWGTNAIKTKMNRIWRWIWIRYKTTRSWLSFSIPWDRQCGRTSNWGKKIMTCNSINILSPESSKKRCSVP